MAKCTPDTLAGLIAIDQELQELGIMFQKASEIYGLAGQKTTDQGTKHSLYLIGEVYLKNSKGMRRKK